MSFGKIRGRASVMKNMTKKLDKSFRATKKGMKVAVLFLEGKMKVVTPVNKGNLISSYRREVKLRGKTVIGEIRNVANYGLYVHEMPKTTNFKKPGATNKFMERPMYENQNRILAILEKYAEEPLR